MHRNPSAPEQVLSGVAGGPLGVLVDHVETWVRVGGTTRPSPSGGTWAVAPDGRAYPLLCGDIVERDYPEGEGKYTDRCGAVARDGACEFHANQRDHWLSLSEAEKIEIEIQEEMYA
jgi:hypothetical protein